ncbi:centrosomal protein of 44 kDa isoform X3 [Chanodichthys erythropterus]|uniref:centrosomal protein of 44 kDa isoform X3 n=1 Tax=Chanodichthys erythropterus TaxID=933992 RepID=UPI00351F4C2B
MATGDLKGSLRKLEASLRSLKYPRDVDYQRLAVGDPSACLPIVLRDVFSYKPLLTKQQFLQFGFAERKVTILCDIIGLVLNKHKELTKESKQIVLQHVSKPKRRPQLKSCIRNEIPSAESNSLVLTSLTVPQNQPLVERHLGSSSAPAQIIRSSNEQPQQEEETQKRELDSDHIEDSPQPTDSTECVLESRLRGVELSLLESVGRLEQRLALMEHRIHALEKSLAGKIIIESNQWENLESRVLLLETRLALTSAQSLTSQDGVFNSGKVESKKNTVSASGFSTVIQQPSDISDNGHILASSSPTATQNFKERLDRIVYMMKDTSNILQNIEPTIKI